jgi:hypothetical protein
LVPVGEESGRLGDSWPHVADYYNDNDVVPRQVQRLGTMPNLAMTLGFRERF